MFPDSKLAADWGKKGGTEMHRNKVQRFKKKMLETKKVDKQVQVRKSVPSSKIKQAGSRKAEEEEIVAAKRKKLAYFVNVRILHF